MERERNTRIIALSLLAISIITLSIAFAMLSSKLNISGSAKLDPINWDIYFDNIDNISKEKGAEIGGVPIIDTSDKRKIKNIEVTLKKPGDKVSFTVDLVNESDITAIISGIKLPTINYKFIEFKAIYTGTNTEVALGNVIDARTAAGEERKNITISIYYSKEKVTNEDLDSIPPEGLNIEFNYELTFEQSDELANMPTTTEKWINGCTTDYVKRDSSETYQVGDLISFCNENKSYRNSDGVLVKGKSEDFYVISDNGQTLTALARYNLLAGNSVNLETGDITEIQSNIKDYGLQSESTMLELTTEGELVSTTLNGFMAFAEKHENNKTTNGTYLGYWTNVTNMELEKPLEKYGTSYPVYIFDSNSSLWEPIDNYRTYFTSMLSKTVLDMRLITYNELLNLGCSADENICTKDFVYKNINYWSGSANNYDYVWRVDANGGFNYNTFSNDDSFGVRPVITINKSEI